jgi:hypothetical protein
VMIFFVVGMATSCAGFEGDRRPAMVRTVRMPPRRRCDGQHKNAL